MSFVVSLYNALFAVFAFEQADGHKDQANDSDTKMARKKEQVIGAAVKIGGKGQTFHKLCDGGACLTEQKHDADGEKLFC